MTQLLVSDPTQAVKDAASKYAAAVLRLAQGLGSKSFTALHSNLSQLGNTDVMKADGAEELSSLAAMLPLSLIPEGGAFHKFCEKNGVRNLLQPVCEIRKRVVAFLKMVFDASEYLSCPAGVRPIVESVSTALEAGQNVSEARSQLMSVLDAWQYIMCEKERIAQGDFSWNDLLGELIGEDTTTNVTALSEMLTKCERTIAEQCAGFFGVVRPMYEATAVTTSTAMAALSADAFLPSAEEMALIGEIATWTVDEEAESLLVLLSQLSGFQSNYTAALQMIMPNRIRIEAAKVMVSVRSLQNFGDTGSLGRVNKHGDLVSRLSCLVDFYREATKVSLPQFMKSARTYLNRGVIAPALGEMFADLRVYMSPVMDMLPMNWESLFASAQSNELRLVQEVLGKAEVKTTVTTALKVLAPAAKELEILMTKFRQLDGGMLSRETMTAGHLNQVNVSKLKTYRHSVLGLDLVVNKLPTLASKASKAASVREWKFSAESEEATVPASMSVWLTNSTKAGLEEKK
eukprot:TRINITY_DN23347_c0_g1_i4.p1 TRINITY_DN23347_c0_g1~~TRINITY_DN23347_c0_g1_i4.p1  ORF type:complete len:517 (+),score=147.47 TRINITY_DN23347_c0_g1_i4:347-1897(+)